MEMAQQRVLRFRPERLEFSDFRVGRLYHQILQISGGNTDDKVNVAVLPQFRELLEVEPEEREGDVLRYTVMFTPQRNEDVNASIMVTCRFSDSKETTKQRIQVVAKTRTVSFRCLSPVIEFGEVILNEKSKKEVELFIEGVDYPEVEFETEDGVPLSSSDLSQQKNALLEQLSLARRSKVSVTNNKAILLVEYLPTAPHQFELTLQLRLRGCLEAKPQRISFRGSCISLPIVPACPLTNMYICIVGHSYKHKLRFLNRSGSSSKVQIVQPLETRRIFEFNPMMGYISKHSELEVQVTLKIEKDMQGQLSKYRVGEELSEAVKQRFEVPFKISATAQQSPAQFRICFSVTSDRLLINPSSLDFGKVYSGTASKCEITLRNQSALQQEVLFLQQSKHITVDAEQPIKLLSEESRVIRLIYCNFRRPHESAQPPYADESHLRCRVVTGGIAASELRLAYSCMRMYPLLRLSNNKIELPVVQIEETYSTNITLTNESDLTVVFKIFLPFFELCGLQITPVVKALGPFQSIELCLEYSSFFKTLKPGMLKNLQDKYAQANHGARQLGPSEEGRRRGRKISSNTITESTISSELMRLGGKYTKLPEGEHYEWLLPIYFKQKDLPDAAAEVIYLEVSTVSVEKTLLLDHNTIDFGNVPVGQSSVRHLYLTNLDPASDIVRSELHSFSGFEVINSLRRIEKNEKCLLMVRFRPIEEIGFQQKLTLSSDRSMVSCVLRGCGVRPEVVVEPADEVIEMGELLAGQTNTRVLRILNHSKFGTKFKLKLAQEGVRCSNGMSPFTFIPTEGFIQKGCSQQIAATFSPSSPGQDYFRVVEVDVDEQKTKRVVRIHGNCHSNAVYMFEWKDQSALKKKKDRTGRPNDSKVVTLELDSLNEYSVRRLVLGCCNQQLDNTVRRSWKFNAPICSDLSIECSPSEGQLLPGDRIYLEIKAKRSTQPASIANLSILKGVGQWETVKAHIEVITETTDRKIAIDSRYLVLKVYVPQI